jgi:hypothetical protein
VKWKEEVPGEEEKKKFHEKDKYIKEKIFLVGSSKYEYGRLCNL